jgi:pyruvate,water dikinase
MALAAQATIVPVDEFVTDELYPGYRHTLESHPFVIEPLKTFSKADETHFWALDAIHFGHGLVPASIRTTEDAFSWGTQLAAENIGLPPGRGLRFRLGGTHVYMSPIAVDSEWQMQWRGARFGRFLGYFLDNFEEIWSARAQELDAAHDHFKSLDLPALDDAELRTALADAYDYHRWAWTIHFELMYPLIANYLGFYHLVGQLGLDPQQISRYLAGERTSILESDEALWKLAGRARELGVDGLISTKDPAGLKSGLATVENGPTWWHELELFLAEYGWRMEENCVINTPPWIDDPTPVLTALRAFLSQPGLHDFAQAQKHALEERDRAIEEARSAIGNKADVEQFDGALASCRRANFAWWNDHHNPYIDKRAGVPVYRLNMELGRRLVDAGELDAPGDVFFVFHDELFRALDDPAEWKRLKSLVPHRKDYHAEWAARLATLPRVVGTVPEQVNDPILIEVFGLSRHFLDAVRHADEPTVSLSGFPASSGTVEGIARVIMASSDLAELEAGEILVCPGTDPEWTAVFGVIKACVCDGGGSLTHAAIISREYGIPCVVGTALATRNIRSGDRIKVDGSAGTVTVYR